MLIVRTNGLVPEDCGAHRENQVYLMKIIPYNVSTFLLWACVLILYTIFQLYRGGHFYYTECFITHLQCISVDEVHCSM